MSLKGSLHINISHSWHQAISQKSTWPSIIVGHQPSLAIRRAISLTFQSTAISHSAISREDPILSKPFTMAPPHRIIISSRPHHHPFCLIFLQKMQHFTISKPPSTIDPNWINWLTEDFANLEPNSNQVSSLLFITRKKEACTIQTNVRHQRGRIFPKNFAPRLPMKPAPSKT